MAQNNELDIDNLMKALDDEDNAGLLQLDHCKLKAIKNDMLQKLAVSREQLKQLHRTLSEYRYVDEMHELKYGAYIRWIPLKDPSKIKLTNGGIICEILVKDDAIHIVCRNNMHRFFQLRMTENLVFQKLSDQEKVLLSVMDYLNTS